MARYRLTSQEKEVVRKFQHMSIPFDFKAGTYCDYMQYFEIIQIDICFLLLKGKTIDKELLDIVKDGADISTDNLSIRALAFYDVYLEVLGIISKYVH